MKIKPEEIKHIKNRPISLIKGKKMTKITTKENFLQRNRISTETWTKANIQWEVLEAIAKDHQSNISNLESNAEYMANIIQKFPGVHSVRWRVKDTEHLMEKIIRKLAQSAEKYQDINESNYHQKVTDLIGIRALHLFKLDCLEIDQAIREHWDTIETPVIYKRQGDDAPDEELFNEEKFRHENHPKGYRSIHYVITTKPTKKIVTSEIQVRTIFEEGWSEIDHSVRYPNFLKNDLVEYFLATFNRISGSADEMGSFVKSLTSGLQSHGIKLADLERERDEAIAKVGETLKELEKHQGLNAAQQATISQLKTDIDAIRINNEVRSNRIFGSSIFDNDPFSNKEKGIGSFGYKNPIFPTLSDEDIELFQKNLAKLTRPRKKDKD